MHPLTDTRLHERLAQWSVLLISLLIGIALLVISGWAFDIVVLRRPLNGLVGMNPMTAVGLLLSGIAFILYFPQNPSLQRKFFGTILAVCVLTLGAVRFAGSVGDLDIPIDKLLFSDRMEEEAISNLPTRMAPITAACFILTGIMLLLYNKGSLVVLKLVHSIALILSLVALLSLVGYLYQVEAFYGVLTYIPVAIHTAIGFFLLSLAILFKTPGTGIMKEFTSKLAGSAAARILIPAAIIVPIVLGFFRLWGDWAGVYTKEFGVALFVMMIIIFFLAIIWYNAVLLNKKDVVRIDTENILRQSEEKFQKAFTASPAGITITRLPDYSFQDVNDSFLEMTGYTRMELIGRKHTDVGITAEFEDREEFIRGFTETGSAKGVEMTLHGKNGKTIETIASMETVELNGHPYLLSIIYNITERKIAERQLEAVNKELEAFSYSVSHDLRAPLRIIDGYTEILQADYTSKIDEEGNRILGIIKQNARKMGMLIDDLLNLSRLGRKELQVHPVDMHALAHSAIEELNGTRKKGTEIRLDKLEPAKADSNLMKQVWVNLISNAIKYSATKENPVIEISSKKEGTETIYSVKDNGVGFNMQYADKLFGVFQRLHKMTEFEGTGIGLALVSRIINRHGGRVWAEAEVDKGAVFSFAIPSQPVITN